MAYFSNIHLRLNHQACLVVFLTLSLNFYFKLSVGEILRVTDIRICTVVSPWIMNVMTFVVFCNSIAIYNVGDVDIFYWCCVIFLFLQ